MDGAYHLKLSCTKKLSLDYKIHWNSTYLMLVTNIEYKDVFPRLKFRDRHYSSLPSDQEWNMAKTICEKLKIFMTSPISSRVLNTQLLMFTLLKFVELGRS